MAIRLTESRLRQIIREETRRLIRRRIIREGEEGGTLELRFGQPELDVYEESLEITFPYTLGDESDEEKVTYGDLEDAKADPAGVLARFAEECRHLGFRADESIESEDEAERFVKDALLGSPDFDMEQFKSDLRDQQANRFDAEF